MHHQTESEKLKRRLPNVWQLPEQFTYSLPHLLTDLAEALRRVPFTNSNQICLTAPNSIDQDPYKYTGSFFSKDQSQFVFDEAQFQYHIRIFEDLVFSKIYDEIKNYLPLPLGRMRLMNLVGRSCYTMHRDNGIRLHIPLKTNPQCFICFKDSGAVHIPGNGKVFGTNTLLDHTAMNGSFENRIHLVINTVWNDESGKTYLENFGKTEFRNFDSDLNLGPHGQ